MIEPVLLAVGDDALERAGAEVDVGVGQQDPLAAGAHEALVHRVKLSEPTVGELANVERRHARVGGGEAVDDRAGVVGRAIVHQDDLQCRVAVVELGARGGLDLGALVARGDDDGERGPARRRARPEARQHRHGAHRLHGGEHPEGEVRHAEPAEGRARPEEPGHARARFKTRAGPIPQARRARPGARAPSCQRDACGVRRSFRTGRYRSPCSASLL